MSDAVLREIITRDRDTEWGYVEDKLIGKMLMNKVREHADPIP